MTKWTDQVEIMQLNDLVERLPRNDVQPEILVPQGDAFDVNPTTIAGFVAPTLTVSDWPKNASVLLIEAAGAVGKSATAQALAERLNWPLIRAEYAQVGSYSLSGLIQSALGFAGNYIQAVANGKAGVVVDSLDEAQFRAGRDNFLAFIENVWQVCGKPGITSTGPVSIVLLARSDTAETVRLGFLEADVPLAHAHIDFFDFNSASRFIASYMKQRFKETKRPGYNAPLAWSGPFAKLRDDRLRQVASVLLRSGLIDLHRDWKSAENFLGYAPVLIAIAESLAVTNPSAEKITLETQDPNHILTEIINHILKREQAKFSSQIVTKLRANLPAQVDAEVVAENIYLPIEQAVRLIALTTGNAIASPPLAIPQEIQAIYDEAVTSFLSDHPFLRGKNFGSVVFSDYVQAAVCTSVVSRASLKDQPEKFVGEVGPFFARFLASSNSDDKSCVINEDLIEHVVTSWNQEVELIRPKDSHAMITLFDGHASLTCSRATEINSVEEELEFEVSEVSGAFHVHRPLKGAWLVTDQAVILGDTGQSLQLGPNVIIIANEIDCLMETLRVENRVGTGLGVALSADILSANYLSRVTARTDCLSVYSEDPPPGLRPYRQELSIDDQRIPFERYIDLKSILTAFKTSTKGGLSVLDQKLEQRIVRDNEHRQSILDRLMKDGAISRQGHWFYLDLNALGKFGFGLNDLKLGEPSDPVLKYLTNCGSRE